MKVDTVTLGADSAGPTALREVRRHIDDFPLVDDSHWDNSCGAVGDRP
ncbi:hypothetical protein [Roseovarius sp.]